MVAPDWLMVTICALSLPEDPSLLVTVAVTVPSNGPPLLV